MTCVFMHPHRPIQESTAPRASERGRGVMRGREAPLKKSTPCAPPSCTPSACGRKSCLAGRGRRDWRLPTRDDCRVCVRVANMMWSGALVILLIMTMCLCLCVFFLRVANMLRFGVSFYSSYDRGSKAIHDRTRSDACDYSPCAPTPEPCDAPWSSPSPSPPFETHSAAAAAGSV